MRFFVTNKHNGKKYPAEAQHWPEHGWSVDIFDFTPGTWGSAQTGVGDGPVIAKGWQHDLERQGWDFPPLTAPKDIRADAMKKLAQSFQPKPEPPPATESKKIDWGKRVRTLRKRRGEPADDLSGPRVCGYCGAINCEHAAGNEPLCGYASGKPEYPPKSKTESRAEHIVATLLDHCGHCPEDRQLSVGTKLEKEHFRGDKPKDKTPAEVAATHLGENPHYYPLSKKPKGAKEALRWVKGNSAMPKPKGSFYPSSGGPSSI